MPHGAPDAIELDVDALEVAQPVEVGGRDAFGGDERPTLRGEQLAHRGLDMLRLDGGIGRQHARGEKWICVGRCRLRTYSMNSLYTQFRPAARL